ncbi:MAG TPA: hypothetical protein VK673_17240 [Chthoniobacterales bacterium]|nr:hypothetical protein [Chthoniobacterales bacterium]
MKIGLLLLGLSLTLSAFSHAGPVRGGFHGGGFHTGFAAARGFNRFAVRGGGFRGRFSARRNRPVFFQQYGWPAYWYPYGSFYDDSLNYSYLEPDSPSDYQYWDNSSYLKPSPAYVRAESTNRAVPQSPVVIVINSGNPRATDSGVLTDPRGDGRYFNNGYNYNAGLGQQRVVEQDPKNDTPPGSMTPGDPVVPQATPVPQPNTKTSMQPGPGPFGKLVVVSYLNDRGKDVISVKNIETNDVQRITSQPNIDHLRIVEIHPNPDLRQFEAIISNGSDQGPVRFQF